MSALLSTAHQLAPDIAAASDDIDRLRALPDDLARRILDAGFHRIMLGEADGGFGADPATAARLVERLSAANGSVGWVVFITIGTPHWVYAFITDDAASEIRSSNDDAVFVGTFGPNGRAVRENGGVRVTGRWPFGSGSQLATWFASGCTLYDGDDPVVDEQGQPELAVILTPRADTRVIDTWDTVGLRGTGSNDYALNGCFVPHHRVLKHPYKNASPRPEPLYAYLPLSAPLMAAVPLGIARGAVDELRNLLTSHAGNPQTIPPPDARANLGRADALVSAASTYLYHVLDDVWSTVTASRSLSRDQRGRFRAALTHANESALQAVDLAYHTAGGAAIHKGGALERHFRDIHAMTSHALLRPGTMADAGTLLSGLDPGRGVF